jgi:hypothetical protein
MSSGRGKGGRTGIAGNVNVALEKEDGTNTPLPADDEGLLIAKVFGQDNNGNDNPLSVDSKGRLTVKQPINPATEGTLSTIETNTDGLAQESTLSTIETNTDGLFEASDFTEDRNVRELQNETGIISGQDTGGGSLPSNAVPDGKTIRVQALQGNGAKIEIDGNFELVAGQAVDLAVDNTDKISYTAGTGDGICFIVES